MIKTTVMVAVLAVVACSCAPNQRIVESNGQWVNTDTNRTAATPVPSSLEKEIESMRTADFIFIYVIKRKDGAALDAEDKKFAGAVIPGEMNRRTVADEGKAILIGSNFRMPEESQKLIVDRFTFEDLSREVPSATSNANANANR
jgi:hypothetical protein